MSLGESTAVTEVFLNSVIALLAPKKNQSQCELDHVHPGSEPLTLSRRHVRMTSTASACRTERSTTVGSVGSHGGEHSEPQSLYPCERAHAGMTGENHHESTYRIFADRHGS